MFRALLIYLLMLPRRPYHMVLIVTGVVLVGSLYNQRALSFTTTGPAPAVLTPSATVPPTALPDAELDADDIIVHRVVEGDTIESIAQMYGVSVELLAAINDTSLGGLVVGQELQVPVPDAARISVQATVLAQATATAFQFAADNASATASAPESSAEPSASNGDASAAQMQVVAVVASPTPPLAATSEALMVLMLTALPTLTASPASVVTPSPTDAPLPDTPAPTPTLPVPITATPDEAVSSASLPLDTQAALPGESAASTDMAGTSSSSASTDASVSPPAEPTDDMQTVVYNDALADARPPDAVTLWLQAPRDTPMTTLNNIALDAFLTVDSATAMLIRQTYQRGRSLGRNPLAFSRLGDSTIEAPHFFIRFDQAGSYNLGDYSYLQPVVDAFSGSFGHEGVTVRRGLHTWSVFDPMWADPTVCSGGEHMLACEIRTHNPAFLLLRIGSNDVGVPEATRQNIARMVQYCLDQGVVPIIGTKADRNEGSDINNTVMRTIAAEYHVPLWDLDLLMTTLPNHGLEAEGVHLTTFFQNDWRQPAAFTRGQGLQNLSALMVLDRVWRIANGG